MPSYHHYVPRFILRNFAANTDARELVPDAEGLLQFTKATKLASARQKTFTVYQATPHGSFSPLTRAYDRKRQPSIPMNVYHLGPAKLLMAAEGSILADFSNTVEKNFGHDDLYLDPSNANTQHVETLLSKLEGDAALVIRKIVDAAEAGFGHVRLMRRELNTLHKFLFIMFYRHTDRAEQYLQDRLDQVVRNDVDEYIRRFLHPAATARDVWLQTIKQILETDYWNIPKNERVFIHDRDQFETTMRWMHLVMWHASDDREFVTCNDGFGFVDAQMLRPPEELLDAALESMQNAGSTVQKDDQLQPFTGGTYTWVRLFPIHPRLCLALVDEAMDMSFMSQRIFPTLNVLNPQGSRYAGFPIPRAKTVHRVESGVRVAPASPAVNLDGHSSFYKDDGTSILPHSDMGGYIMESRENDELLFELCKLSSPQTERVAAMFLENASETLAFLSPARMYRNIQAFESSDVWHHKRSYTTLKAQIRAFYNTPCPSAIVTPVVLSTCTELIWVRSVPCGRDDYTPVHVLVEKFRAAMFRIRLGLSYPELQLEVGAREEMRVAKHLARDAIRWLNRVHDDNLLRREEAWEAAQAEAAGVGSPTSPTSSAKRRKRKRKGGNPTSVE